MTGTAFASRGDSRAPEKTRERTRARVELSRDQVSTTLLTLETKLPPIPKVISPQSIIEFRDRFLCSMNESRDCIFKAILETIPSFDTSMLDEEADLGLETEAQARTIKLLGCLRLAIDEIVQNHYHYSVLGIRSEDRRAFANASDESVEGYLKDSSLELQKASECLLKLRIVRASSGVAYLVLHCIGSLPEDLDRFQDSWKTAGREPDFSYMSLDDFLSKETGRGLQLIKEAFPSVILGSQDKKHITYYRPWQT